MLCIPPIADPIAARYVITANQAPSLACSLSSQLLFLQEILQEYIMSEPYWDAEPANAALFIDVKAKLEAAMAAQTVPIFNETESMWLQETLITYQQTHSDWRRRLPSFNEMNLAFAAVANNFQDSPTLQAIGPTNNGMTPPPADPFNYPNIAQVTYSEVPGIPQTVLCQTQTVVKIGFEGPQGPPGSQADWNAVSGPSEILNKPPAIAISYLYTQSSPASTWTVVHNLNTYPSVTIIDSSGNQVIGEVHYDSLNQCTLSFAGEMSGSAALI